jgi:hypothetical protein
VIQKNPVALSERVLGAQRVNIAHEKAVRLRNEARAPEIADLTPIERSIVAAERLTDNQTMPAHTDAFSAEALAENHRGCLTGDQATRFKNMVRERRRSTRGLALPVGAIGALLLLFSGPSTTAATRHVAGWGFLAAALAILAAPAFDPIAADVREGRVETVEGAIGKRRVQTNARASAASRYYVIVAGRQLQTYLSAYDAAPDVGYVRAFYLPRTRKLVNLERLPNPPLRSEGDEPVDTLARMARALVSSDPVVRASLADLMDASRDSIIEPSASKSGAAAGGLVRDAVVGRWTSPLVTITLAEDGTATVTTIAGLSQAGHWSIDAHGRLLTDATGTMEPAEAALEGDRLTIQLEGRRLTFTRGGRA